MFSNAEDVINSLNLSPQIKEQLLITSQEHKITKYHEENLYTHLFWVATKCKELAPTFDVNPNDAFWLGFLHDIGKSLARHQVQKHFIYTGHAQLGARIVENMFLKETKSPCEHKNAVLWAIDNHMCACCKNVDDTTLVEKYKSLLWISAPKGEEEMCLRFLLLLQVADEVGKQSSFKKKEEASIIQANRIFKMMLPYVCDTQKHVWDICQLRKSDSSQIIIVPLGLSGSGKSSLCKKIQMSSNYKVGLVERDQCYFQIALENGFIADELSTYKDYYTFVQTLEKGKEMVQKRWVKMVDEILLDKSNKIILIDSVQPTFRHAWKRTLDQLSEEARLCWNHIFKMAVYLVPIHQLGFNVESKIGSYQSLPSTDPSLFWPMLNVETGQTNLQNFDIGTGQINRVLDIAERFLSIESNYNLLPQISLLKLIEKSGSLEDALKTFPKDLIITQTEHEDSEVKIVTVCYQDGLQTFMGDTRDYRGESILLDKQSGQTFLVRGSLPVFPDYTQIQKDPYVLPYTEDKLEASYKVTMKYDGSLFNVTFINKCTDVYPFVKKIIDKRKDWFFNEIQNGILLFGSKGRLMTLDSNPVKYSIIEAILGTYNTHENFVNTIEKFVSNIEENCTLHFEAINKVPSSLLTVYYGRDMVKFIGSTTFDVQKKFSLPTLDIFKEVATVYEFETFIDILKFWEEGYEKLLEGDQEIEPEGFVVHIFPKHTNLWYPVKLKYQFYYIAHKPSSEKNKEGAKEIATLTKYDKLRNRLSKFREKVHIELIVDSFVQASLETLKEEPHSTKKEWAQSVNKKTESLTKISDAMNSKLKEETWIGKIKIQKYLLDSWSEDFKFDKIKEDMINKIKAYFSKSNLV